jgi:hypothetical protein
LSEDFERGVCACVVAENKVHVSHDVSLSLMREGIGKVRKKNSIKKKA